MISPPAPPSPPSGPPRGTNFSRRQETTPFPPSPALAKIRMWSINMGAQLPCGPARSTAMVRARAISWGFAARFSFLDRLILLHSAHEIARFGPFDDDAHRPLTHPARQR